MPGGPGRSPHQVAGVVAGLFGGVQAGFYLMAGESKEALKLLATFGTIGMTMVFSIFIGLGIGYFLDHKVFDGRSAPWLTLIFLAFGVAAAFRKYFPLDQKRTYDHGGNYQDEGRRRRGYPP